MITVIWQHGQFNTHKEVYKKRLHFDITLGPGAVDSDTKAVWLWRNNGIEIILLRRKHRTCPEDHVDLDWFSYLRAHRPWAWLHCMTQWVTVQCNHFSSLWFQRHPGRLIYSGFQSIWCIMGRAPIIRQSLNTFSLLLKYSFRDV